MTNFFLFLLVAAMSLSLLDTAEAKTSTGYQITDHDFAMLLTHTPAKGQQLVSCTDNRCYDVKTGQVLQIESPYDGYFLTTAINNTDTSSKEP